MKNTGIKLSLLSTALLGTLVISLNVDAAGSVKSNANVEFRAPDINAPVDPSDPETEEPVPVIPDPEIKPPIVYPGGPLRINHVPSMSFGVNDISSKTSHYFAKFENVINVETNEAIPKASYIEVADLTGELKGWEVKASSDGLFKSAKGNIMGKITLTNPVVRGLDGMELQMDKAAVAKQSVVIGETPGAVSILSAEAGKGYNKWQARYGHSDTSVAGADETLRNPQVKLTIPAGQQVMAGQEYVAEINWVLEQGL